MESESSKQARTAIKIALLSVFILLILGSIGIWIMLNQITAQASIQRTLKTLQQQVQELESKACANKAD